MSSSKPRGATRTNSKPKQRQGRLPPGKSGRGGGSDSARLFITDDAIYFFGSKGEYGYLSQWYATSFTDGTYSYKNAEQYMMHQKGVLFAPDSPITSAILGTTNPRNAKALGRKVPNFDDAVWTRERFNIVTEGSRLKFKQNESLKAQLLATGNKELIEASPFDRIWGVGFDAKRAPLKRDKWGANLLGKALMAVRQELQEEATIDNIDTTPQPGPSEHSSETNVLQKVSTHQRINTH